MISTLHNRRTGLLIYDMIHVYDVAAMTAEKTFVKFFLYGVQCSKELNLLRFIALSIAENNFSSDTGLRM